MDRVLPQRESYRLVRGEGDDIHRPPNLWSPPLPETPGTGVSAESGASQPLFGGLRSFASPPLDYEHSQDYRVYDAYRQAKGAAVASAVPLDDLPPVRPPPGIGSTSLPIAWRSDAFDKIALLLAGLVPAVAGGFIFTGRIHDARTTGIFLQLVIEQRAAVQIVVSIIAAILAALNIFILTTVLNLGARVHILRRSMDLNSLKFVSAIATRQYGSGLPFPLAVGAFVAVLMFAIPNVMWTGALTPVLVTTNSTLPSAIPLPQFSLSTNNTWANNSVVFRSDCNFTVNNGGIFSDCATSTIQDSMLKHASLASQNRTGLHEKIDNGHYNYAGRSYGVGSAVGIFDGEIPGSLGNETLLFYNYTEMGYLTEVQCGRNTSMDFGFVERVPQNPDDGSPGIFQAEGYFPWETPNEDRSNIEHFAVVGFDESELAVMFCKQSQNKGGTKLIWITTGSAYPFLNNTQCAITFTPTEFAVQVDVVGRVIRVEPQQTLADEAFDPTGGLATTMVNQMNAVSMIATTLYTSTVGDALMANINVTANASTTDAERWEELADSFAGMFDDLLVFVGSSQFFVPNNGSGDWTLADAQLTMQAVQLGEIPYVIAVFILCVALILLVLEEALRTRLWRSLPRWDLTDPTCLVLAGAVAGDDLLRRMGHRDLLSGHAAWNGDGRENLGGARLRLGQKSVPTSSLPSFSAVPGMSSDEGHPGTLAAVAFHTYGARDTEPLR